MREAEAEVSINKIDMTKKKSFTAYNINSNQSVRSVTEYDQNVTYDKFGLDVT